MPGYEEQATPWLSSGIRCLHTLVNQNSSNSGVSTIICHLCTGSFTLHHCADQPHLRKLGVCCIFLGPAIAAIHHYYSLLLPLGTEIFQLPSPFPSFRGLCPWCSWLQEPMGELLELSLPYSPCATLSLSVVPQQQHVHPQTLLPFFHPLLQPTGALTQVRTRSETPSLWRPFGLILLI